MSDYYLGEIRMFGFNYPPRGWAKCDGQYLQISQYQAIFALLNTFYGGNGTTNFCLPDLQGRMPMAWGSSQSGGLQNVQFGQMGGQALTTLTQQQMPQHTHAATFTSTGSGGGSTQVQLSSDIGTETSPSSSTPYIAGTPSGQASAKMWAGSLGNAPVTLGGVSGSAGGGGTITVDAAGSGQAFSTVSPYLALNFSIALLDGMFPARN